MARKRISKDEIVALATSIIAERGTDALTYQVLADGLGVSKQAIIYWYPSKAELTHDLIVPALRHEAEVAITAISGSRDAADAIARFVRAFVGHHLANLGQFRMLYLTSRPTGAGDEALFPATLLDEIHAITGPMYGALAGAIGAVAPLPSAEVRRRAVAVHMAAIGLLTMVSLADAIGDPLAHPTDMLVASLIEVLVSGALGHKA